MRTAISSQFQYRAANYFYMLGMVAEPVIYLVVWTTIADESGGSVAGLTAGEFAAYYIVWTLVRNMNVVFARAVLGVADPRGRAVRPAAAAAPSAPLRHRVTSPGGRSS